MRTAATPTQHTAVPTTNRRLAVHPRWAVFTLESSHRLGGWGLWRRAVAAFVLWPLSFTDARVPAKGD
jgi:hypothetical protein